MDPGAGGVAGSNGPHKTLSNLLEPEQSVPGNYIYISNAPDERLRWNPETQRSRFGGGKFRGRRLHPCEIPGRLFDVTGLASSQLQIGPVKKSAHIEGVVFGDYFPYMCSHFFEGTPFGSLNGTPTWKLNSWSPLRYIAAIYLGTHAVHVHWNHGNFSLGPRLFVEDVEPLRAGRFNLPNARIACCNASRPDRLF